MTRDGFLTRSRPGGSTSTLRLFTDSAVLRVGLTGAKRCAVRRVFIVEPGDQAAAELRRALKPFAPAWGLCFVRSAEDVLAAMPGIDAVICDAKAPGVVSLLNELKDRHPRCARTVLVHEDAGGGDAIARLQVLSHQLVRSPVMPSVLFDVVDRTLAVIESMSSERLQGVVGQLGDLPPLPATYSRLSALTAQPDTSLDAISSVVERDPAVTAAVLRIINSAYYGLPRRIASVREAVRCLGVIALKDLVLTVELFEGLALGPRALSLLDDALMRACAMRDLFGRTPQADEAFVAGVLSDVGQLLLLSRLPRDAEAIEQRIAAGVLPWEAQHERLGCTAATIGAQLLLRWNLPPTLVEAIALQHRPPKGTPTSNITTALCLVHAVEWSRRAPAALREGFEATAQQLVEAFPSARLDLLGRALTRAA